MEIKTTPKKMFKGIQKSTLYFFLILNGGYYIGIYWMTGNDIGVGNALSIFLTIVVVSYIVAGIVWGIMKLITTKTT